MPGNIEIVRTAIDYIESHLHEKQDLDTIAETLHYSKYHLHRMFTDTVGLTIRTYAQRRRLTEAAKLLVFSDKPILEIALTAGYESQQSFLPWWWRFSFFTRIRAGTITRNYRIEKRGRHRKVREMKLF